MLGELARNAEGKAVFWVQGKRQKIEVLYGPPYPVAVVFLQLFRCLFTDLNNGRWQESMQDARQTQEKVLDFRLKVVTQLGRVFVDGPRK